MILNWKNPKAEYLDFAWTQHLRYIFAWSIRTVVRLSVELQNNLEVFNIPTSVYWVRNFNISLGLHYNIYNFSISDILSSVFEKSFILASTFSSFHHSFHVFNSFVIIESIAPSLELCKKFEVRNGILYRNCHQGCLF